MRKPHSEPRTRTFVLVMLTFWFAAAVPALAWDEEGHIIVTQMAIERMPTTMPDWLRSPEVRSRLTYLCAEPDRWKGQHSAQLDHMNNPEHYLDVESLADYGLTLKTLPSFRREFIDVLATRRALNPEQFPKYDRAKDPTYIRLTPGLLPYRVAELEWQLASSWTTLKTYEQNPSLVNDELIRNARENVVYHMGIISHYIGDGSQPLHTTIHHNGWEGPNPNGYTTDKKFHQLIDGGLIGQFRITPDSLRSRALPPKKVSSKEYWPMICQYLDDTQKNVEPLYALEKSGELYKPEGKRFIEDRLLDGGAMLAGVWVAAYEAATIDDFRVNQLKARKQGEPQDRSPGQPATRPAGSGEGSVGG